MDFLVGLLKSRKRHHFLFAVVDKFENMKQLNFLKRGVFFFFFKPKIGLTRGNIEGWR